MIVLVVLVVFVVVVVVAVGAYRQRPEHTIESGISSFRREMRALAPPGRRPNGRRGVDGVAEGDRAGEGEPDVDGTEDER